MPIPLGILAAAGIRPAGVAGAYELIETVTVGSGGAASVTFSNLNTYSTTYQHLQIRGVARSSWSGAQAGLTLRFNGDTASNYSYHGLGGNGSSVSSFAGATQSFMYSGVATGNGATANAFSGVVIDILDPYEAKNKTIRTLFANATTEVGLHSGNWRSTNAVSSISLQTDVTSNFLQFTRFSIYGLKASA